MNAWTEIVAWIATAIALAGVLANNGRLRWCFLLWLVSNAASCGLYLQAGMWALAVRDAAFFGLAVHGWFAWGSGKTKV